MSFKILVHAWLVKNTWLKTSIEAPLKKSDTQQFYKKNDNPGMGRGKIRDFATKAGN